MRAWAASPAAAGTLSWASVALVVLLAWSALVALAAGTAGRTEAAAWAGAAFGGGLVLLLAGGWSVARPLGLLAITLPLPALYGTESLRIAPPLLLTAVLVAAFALRHAPRPGRIAWGALPRRAILLWLGAVAFSALFAEHLGPAARELTSLALLLALLVVAVHELTARPERRRDLATALAWVAGLAGVAASLQAAGALPTPFTLADTGFGRATLGFAWPNEAGMFMALLVPFSVHAFVVAGSRGRRVVASMGVVAALAGLVATFSRGSWLAVAAAPTVLLLVGRWRFVLRVWAGAAVAVLGVELVSGGAVSSRVAMTMGDPLVGQRLALMLTGLLMFADNPLVGVGPGGFAPELDRYGTQVSQLWDFVGSAHNTYIQAAAETGVLGLAAMLLFLGVTFRVVLHRARAAHRRRDDRATEPSATGLPTTALWAFTTVCLVSMVEWSLAQGVGQLAVLIVALGVAGAGQGGEAASTPATAGGDSGIAPRGPGGSIEAGHLPTRGGSP